MREVDYKIVKYAEQAGNKSPGVGAGMWSVIRMIEEDIAFTDTEDKAHALLNDLRKLQRVTK